MQRSKRTCPRGHTYYKSSDCPSCPVCEAERKPDGGWLASIPAPARRALEGLGIDSLQTLSTYTEATILEQHGIGPSSIPKLRKALEAVALQFRNG